jgi:hypothetical protein
MQARRIPILAWLGSAAFFGALIGLLVEDPETRLLALLGMVAASIIVATLVETRWEKSSRD